jgi:hypothetical protein
MAPGPTVIFDSFYDFPLTATLGTFSPRESEVPLKGVDDPTE